MKALPVPKRVYDKCDLQQKCVMEFSIPISGIIRIFGYSQVTETLIYVRGIT